MKSVALEPVPLDVVAAIRPDDAAEGTVKLSAVVDVALAVAETPFRVTVVALATKLVPVTATLVPEPALVGVKLVIVGAPDVTTLKLVALDTVTPLTVTEMGPVVAPVGTVVEIDPADEALTDAAVPLKVTVLLPGVVLNPAPVIVTAVPTDPLVGLKLVIASDPVDGRATFVMLPAAS
jgi:hypothetical protein